MNRPVCVKCSVEMKCVKNGVGVLEWSADVMGKITDADMYECPFCHHQVVTSFAPSSTSHYDSDFETIVSHYREKCLLVNNYEWKDGRVGRGSHVRI